MLLKKSRNELFNKVIEAGLNPADFEEINKDKYTLSIKKISSRFVIYEGDYGYDISGFPGVLGNYDGSSTLSWNDVISGFEKWTQDVKEELETPDLWAEAQANAKLFALNATAPNEMFNSTELRQLEGQVRQLVQGLAALGLPANAQRLLTETINEIPEKATRFTKKELAGWFMGAFAAQVTNLALSQEHVSAIATLIKTTFMGILQLH